MARSNYKLVNGKWVKKSDQKRENKSLAYLLSLAKATMK